jgi:hypothetical protein
VNDAIITAIHLTIYCTLNPIPVNYKMGNGTNVYDELCIAEPFLLAVGYFGYSGCTYSTFQLSEQGWKP